MKHKIKRYAKAIIIFIPAVILIFFATFGMDFCEWCDKKQKKIHRWIWREE